LSQQRKRDLVKLTFSAKIVFLGLIVISCMAFFGSSAATETPRTINIVAKRFTYEPDNITIKKGEPVVLELTTTDVAHGLKFKELNLNTRVEKGKKNELAFTPTKAGDFNGQCSVFCGSGHGSMHLTLHVTE
jgi:cytochrome c oxidase subunit II